MRFLILYFFTTILFNTTGFCQLDGKNRKPHIVGQRPLSTNEEGSITIQMTDLIVEDKDDLLYPIGFTMKIHNGNNYIINNSNTITPALNFTGALSVVVTVNDGQDDSPKYDLQIEVRNIDDPPIITGQVSIQGEENKSLTLQLNQLIVSDPDNTYPNDFRLIVLASNDNTYTVSGNQVTPAFNFEGTLTVSVQVNDGKENSPVYGLQVKINPGKAQFTITGQVTLSVNEDQQLTLQLSNLIVTDSDNKYPSGFTIKILPGNNYTSSGTTLTPTPNFNGVLSANVVVSNGKTDSNVFVLMVTVVPVNDIPVVTIETSPIAYSINDPPVYITQEIKIEDVDDDSLAKAEVSFKPDTYVFILDELIYENIGNLKSTYDKERGSLVLTGKAPFGEYVNALRSIKYNFVPNTAIPFETKVLQITVNDGKANSVAALRYIGDIIIIPDFDIPTAFTPNGDSANDTWVITPLKQTDELSGAILRVYNKRGTLLFESKGFDRPWDGRLQGEILPADTYFYTIDLNLNNPKSLLRGIVTILR